jgi:hypothetical protein
MIPHDFVAWLIVAACLFGAAVIAVRVVNLLARDWAATRARIDDELNADPPVCEQCGRPVELIEGRWYHSDLRPHDPTPKGSPHV